MRYFDNVKTGDGVRCIQECIDNSITVGKVYRVMGVLKCNSDYDMWVTIIDNSGFMDDYHLSLFEDIKEHRNEIIEYILK